MKHLRFGYLQGRRALQSHNAEQDVHAFLFYPPPPQEQSSKTHNTQLLIQRKAGLIKHV